MSGPYETVPQEARTFPAAAGLEHPGDVMRCRSEPCGKSAADWRVRR